MKSSKSLLVSLLVTGVTMQLSAATWRLNPNPEAKADFTSIADAMADDRVNEGDELLLDPGQYDDDVTLTKNNITQVRAASCRKTAHGSQPVRHR